MTLTSDANVEAVDSVLHDLALLSDAPTHGALGTVPRSVAKLSQRKTQ
jgi:hypothetical protein